MGRPKAAAAPKPERPVRYRVNGTELPEGQEPDWEHLEPWAHVQKYTWGAGFLTVPPIKPTTGGAPWPPRDPS